ncbi:hypothetical protein K2173_024249 [Erythroxylum novogranatense]|uniref:DNA-directed RNA polymerase n=1 Tax=Erythroxylum novogranatense TaxID=1862640 RepID=A0AAV8UF13_9ROSI|nr:hypothetical protein K2173_024249 [Erythroxylum novogranatense]
MKGQADTINIGMRRVLLGEIKGICITRVKSEKIAHEFSTIPGIQESVYENLMNLKEIVLRSNLYGIHDASICVKGPRYVTFQDIILPRYVEIIDNTQHIASLTEPLNLAIELQIKGNCNYRVKPPNNFQDGGYPIDVVFMSVQNKKNQHKVTLPLFTVHDRLAKLRKNKKQIIYNCLKRSNLHTLSDLLNTS